MGHLAKRKNFTRVVLPRWGLRGKQKMDILQVFQSLTFTKIKSKNLRVREARSRYIRVSFDRDDEADDKTLDVAQALLRLYTR